MPWSVSQCECGLLDECAYIMYSSCKCENGHIVKGMIHSVDMGHLYTNVNSFLNKCGSICELGCFLCMAVSISIYVQVGQFERESLDDESWSCQSEHA